MVKRESQVIEKTILFWSRQNGMKLSQEEGREAVANIAGFFKVLSDWNCKILNEDTRVQALTSPHAVRRMRGAKRTR